MTTTITVDRVEDLTSAGGRLYWKVHSSMGEFYSIFLKAVADEFKKEIGNRVNINYQENDQGFKTIRAMPKHDTISDTPMEKIRDSEEGRSSSRGISLTNTLISSAKDIFITLYSAQQLQMQSSDSKEGSEMASEVWTADFMMEKAISLVNKAKLFFEKDPVDQLAESMK